MECKVGLRENRVWEYARDEAVFAMALVATAAGQVAGWGFDGMAHVARELR